MRPGSFDEATCRELIGDERARLIEADARGKAERGEPLEREAPTAGYWAQVQQEAQYRVALTAHRKRTERMTRKANINLVLPASVEGNKS